MFSDFDERAFAAASIGQVHRATTIDGRRGGVKVQYPGVAEAVETDLRNAMMLLPLVKRLAPGPGREGAAAEMRERIGEELDYELEAQNQRRIERLMRGHPFVRVPRVHTDLSTRRVLVSEYVEGERFEAVRRADEAQRDRYGEIVFRFFFGLLYRDRIALGDPASGQLPAVPRRSRLLPGLRPAARRRRGTVAAERAIARAVRDRRRGGAEGRPASPAGTCPPTAPTRSSRLRAGADADGDQVVRRARRAPLLALTAADRGRDRERPDGEQRAADRGCRSTSSPCRPRRS